MRIEDIRNLISQSKLEEALEAMQALAAAENDNDLSNTLTLLSGQYNANERNNRIGIITPQDYGRTRNRISYSLLETLNDLNDGDPINQPAGTHTPGHNDPVRPIEDGITNILFLAANPLQSAKLQLEKEHSRVSTKLQDSPRPDLFQLKHHRRVTPSELQEFLITDKPDIVHFSGHGTSGGEEVTEALTRAGRLELIDEEQPVEASIILVDEDNFGFRPVSVSSLRRTFSIAVRQQPIKAIVFNACYSEPMAVELSKLGADGIYVVGTSYAIKDDAAMAFAQSFYFGIAQSMTIEDAYNLGVANAINYGEPEDRFRLYRKGEIMTF